MDEAAGFDFGKPAAPPHRGNHNFDTIRIDVFRGWNQRHHNDNHCGVSRGPDVRRGISDSSRDQQTDPAFPRQAGPADFLEGLGFRPRKFQMDRRCGMLQPSIMTREQKRFSTVGPERFIDRVAEQQTVIQNGDLGFFRCRNHTIDVDEGRHRSRARSQSKRCFSVFGSRRGTSISGSRPKLIFIGAKCFCGLET